MEICTERGGAGENPRRRLFSEEGGSIGEVWKC